MIPVLWVGLAGAARLDGPLPEAADLHLTLDPAAEAFSGEIALAYTFDHRTRSVSLHAQGLTFTAASLEVDGQRLPATVGPKEDQTVQVGWASTARGPATLHLAWTGLASATDTDGLFRQEEGGRPYLFSQFEPISARRAFPIVDEPGLKIPYTVSLSTPAGLVAAANAPLVGTRIDGDRAHHSFAPTRPLPAYLVAFAVGPFDVVPLGALGRAGRPTRLLVPAGRAADAAASGAAVGPLLGAIEAWFDSPLPYEKLDIVAIPDPIGFGGMENAGLITASLDLMVVRPELDSPARQRSWALLLAHELAHHWFGDWVTPAWWDDLWLNESFASYLAGVVVEQLHPDWSLPALRVADQGGAMATDTLPETRAVRQPVTGDGDILTAFDAIAYEKGEALLHMIAAWMGPEPFRAGVRQYLADHADGSATADDLLRALDAAGDRPVSPILGPFLERPGLPRLAFSLDCAAGATPRLSVHARRHLPGGQSSRSRWRVPMRLRYPTPAGPAETQLLLRGRREAVALPGAVDCPGWILPNVDQRGYYRVAWTDAQLAPLLGPAAPDLSLSERVGLLQDASAMVAAGQVSPTLLLGALPQLLALEQPAVTATTLPIVRALDAHLVPDALRPSYAAFLRRTYGPLAAQLGWEPKPGEDDATRRLRPALLGLVGGAGEDPVLRAEAQRRAEQWLTTRQGTAAELVPLCLQLTAIDGDLSTFEALRDGLGRDPDKVPRGWILSAMGRLRDPVALTAALDFALTSGEVGLGEATSLLYGPLSRPRTADVLYRYALDHLPQIEAKVPAVGRAYLSYVGAGFCSPADRARVEADLKPLSARWVGGGRVLTEVLGEIDQCVANKARQEPGVIAFLSAQPPP